MPNAAITSTGSFLPEQIVHNEDFRDYSASSRKLISQKTGVLARRRAADDACTSDLGLKAAENCLARVDFAPQALEGIIVSTSSPDRMQPATATRIQHMLGAHRAFAFDINSVCSGSVFGFALADALIRSGQCRNILFIAAELYSRILNPQDFSTFPYFGDGAGAVLFQSSDESEGVMHSILCTEGAGADTICVPGGGTMLPFDRMQDRRSAYFKMKGKEVFQFAVSRGARIIQDVLHATELAASEIKCFICHQANVHILLKIAETLDIAAHKFYINLFRYGNTASASVPIALDECIARCILRKGDLAVTAAFGGGLSWGANVLRI